MNRSIKCQTLYSTCVSLTSRQNSSSTLFQIRKFLKQKRRTTKKAPQSSRQQILGKMSEKKRRHLIPEALGIILLVLVVSVAPALGKFNSFTFTFFLSCTTIRQALSFGMHVMRRKQKRNTHTQTHPCECFAFHSQ